MECSGGHTANCSHLSGELYKDLDMDIEKNFLVKYFNEFLCFMFLHLENDIIANTCPTFIMLYIGLCHDESRLLTDIFTCLVWLTVPQDSVLFLHTCVVIAKNLPIAIFNQYLN